MSNNLKQLVLPDIRDTVYATHSRLEAVQKYMVALKSYDSLESKMLHNKLQTDYLRYISNTYIQEVTKKSVCSIHKQVISLHPDCSVTTKAREKALMSYIHKNIINLKEGKSLDKIMDTRACRVIIDSKDQDKEKLSEILGNIVNEILTFLLNNGYQFCSAPKPKSTENFTPSKHPDVYIPKKYYIRPEYNIFVKNYVLTPKENGYQSYHVLVIDPDGNVLEIQFRTFDMDFFAEHRLAGHDKYKDEQIKKYSLPILDRSKVHWANYRYEKFEALDDDGNIVQKTVLKDSSGLEKSLSIECLVYNP